MHKPNTKLDGAAKNRGQKYTNTEAKRKREQLSDCTNTTTTSSSIKKSYANPSVASAIRKLLNSIDGKNIINSNSEPGENDCDFASGIASTPAKSSWVSGSSGSLSFQSLVQFIIEEKLLIKGQEQEDGDTVMSMSCSTHKRKKKKHDPQHAMTQDSIEKQRAYFAEIDAFELSEEEVELADQLEYGQNIT